MIVTDPGTRGGGKGNEYGLWVYLSQQQNTDGRGCVGGNITYLTIVVCCVYNNR